MAGPYREAVAAEILEAPTRDGPAQLEVAPRHVTLRVGEHLTLSVTERFASVTRMVRNKPKKRSLRLKDARVLVARAVPTEDAGIWHEATPGAVTRLFGLDKPGLQSDGDFHEEWRKLDILVRALHGALEPHAGGVERSYEVGTGADRVLIMDFGDRLLFHVRRLFREHPMRAFEVYRDGRIAILHPAVFHEPVTGGRFLARLRKYEYEFRCTFRFGISASGDYIRFVDETGDDLGQLSLPWIRAEDRDQLAHIISRAIFGR